jgi:hypothetical protein
MRLFRSGEAPADGATVELAQLAELADRWYGDRLRADWQPRTAEQSQAILDAVGLTGEFWRLRPPAS